MKRMLACMLFLLGTSHAEDAPITQKSMLDWMTKLDYLARIPEPHYTTLQYSSYDRAATDPAVLTDENWFANGDRGKHLREESRNGESEWVMMEAEGPGAVVRIWSANPQDGGTLRIYLDDEDEPVIEAPMTEFLGAVNPYTPEPIGGIRGAGWNSYLPIPYAKRCKITASSPDFYYLINYRRYESGAVVETLTPEILEKNQTVIKRTADQLKHPQLHATSTTSYKVQPGETITLTEQNGSGVVTQLVATVQAERQAEALRELVLTIEFDGKETVSAPFGDFFGTAPGLNPFRSLPLGSINQMLYCRWPMPFRDKVGCRVTNHGMEPVTLGFAPTIHDYEWTDDSLYFHAKWRVGSDLPTRPRQDWNYASIEGRGRFAGVMLHIANPVKDWWGEGDEKIYIDGATFPQWFGTGTEDFFGYAWCDNHLFSHAYHNQPRADGPGNFGHSCVSRFLVPDNIPFLKSFRFDMELWHWKETRITQTVTCYWYADANSTDNFPPITADMLTIPKLPPAPKTKRIPGAIEAEHMMIIKRTAGIAVPQSSDVWEWSNAEQIWWSQAGPGAELELGFNVDEAGDYEVLAVFTKAPDYGIGAIHLNEVSTGEPVDFYHTEVKPMEPPLNLGVHALRQGENHLRITITGANPEAYQQHMIGIDCLILKKK
ncbi:MAG: hypothetical protein RLZZ303_1251 [Candidatus Hydrogenedentota bacterium]|jgi:hypothetical protein